MTRRRRSGPTGFAAAIESAEDLVLEPGLSALKRSEGRERIHQGTCDVLGSVAIDERCRGSFPRASRWDYLIGITETARTKAIFVEVHPADASGVAKVAEKLAWLLEFLDRGSQQALRGLPRELHWVASGRVRIPAHTPQYKRLKRHPLVLLEGQRPKERLDLP